VRHGPLETRKAEKEAAIDSLRLEEGMKVVANYKGKGRFFECKIARDNRDGTYDITYCDGDREFGKRADEIKSLEGGA